MPTNHSRRAHINKNEDNYCSIEHFPIQVTAIPTVAFASLSLPIQLDNGILHFMGGVQF